MVEIAFTESSELLFHTRIDAEFYKPPYAKIYQILNKASKRYELVKLPNLLSVQVKTGSTPNPEERIPKLDGTDVMFIKTDSVRKGLINYESADLLPIEQHEKRKATALKNMDIVVTVVGATHDIVARAGLYLKHTEANINQSDAVIRVNPNKIEAGYLSTFINSKYGRIQLWRYSGQTGQVTINCREVEELQVLMLEPEFRKKIHNMVLESEKLREESKRVYKEAEETLIRELEFDKFKMESSLIFHSKLSTIQNKKRIDADYYLPHYLTMENKLINEFEAKKISDFEFIKITTGQYSEEYVNEGRPYIRGLDINSGTIDTEGLFNINPQQQISSKKAKEGDIVVTRVGSIGISAIIPKELEGGTISDNLIRLRFIDTDILDPYYVIVYLNSIGSQFMVRESRGSVQQRLNQETLKEIYIPCLDKNKQNKIAGMMIKSIELRNEAKNLLKTAVESVENHIEKLTISS